MDRQSIERQLISYCEGARMITADELKGFLLLRLRLGTIP